MPRVSELHVGTRRQAAHGVLLGTVLGSPDSRPPARRRYPQHGKRQCGRHQCHAHAGQAVWVTGAAHRYCQGRGGGVVAAGSGAARHRHRSGRIARNGSPWPAVSPSLWDTSIRCGSIFAAARALPP